MTEPPEPGMATGSAATSESSSAEGGRASTLPSGLSPIRPAAGWASAVSRWRGLPTTALALVALILVVILQPVFFTVGQLTPFLATYSPIAVLAIGVSFTLLVGGIDLSVGPVMGVCAIMTVLLSSVGTHLFTLGPSGAAALCANPAQCQQGLPFPLVVIVVILAGGVFGLVNGIVIAYIRLQPLVATLAMGFVAAGFSLYMMPQPGGQVPLGLLSNYGKPAFISYPLILLVASTLVAALVMRTPLGVRMRAVGSQRWKAYASAVNVGRTTLAAYVGSGICAGVAGVLFTLNAGSADPTVGFSYTLTAIAGAVLGGTALRGGWADPFGPAVGVLTLGLLTQLVTVANVPTYYAQLATGLIILFGLTLTQVALRRSSRVTK